MADPRIAEFRRRVAFFFEVLHPGQTLHTLPAGVYGRELDLIAESLRVQAPTGELAARLTDQAGTIRPAPIPMHVENEGVAARAKRVFDQAVKAGKPVKVVVTNEITGERHVEWQVWEPPHSAPPAGPQSTGGAPEKRATTEDVRRVLQKRPELAHDLRALAAELKLGHGAATMKALKRRLNKLAAESRQEKSADRTQPPAGSSVRAGTQPPAGSSVQ